jgi:hypothetical protein
LTQGGPCRRQALNPLSTDAVESVGKISRRGNPRDQRSELSLLLKMALTFIDRRNSGAERICGRSIATFTKQMGFY